MRYDLWLLKKHGWTIEGLDVFIYEDKWVHRTLDLIDFAAYKEEIKEEIKKKVVDKYDPFL